MYELFYYYDRIHIALLRLKFFLKMLIYSRQNLIAIGINLICVVYDSTPLSTYLATRFKLISSKNL